MRQQLVDRAGSMRWQAHQYVFEVGVRIMAIELGGLDQTHDGGSALACHQRSCEQPVLPSRRPGPDLPFVVVVVDR
jgi:hypothetical protein